MVKIEMKGKFECTDKGNCKSKTKNGLCKIKDRSCIFIKWKPIIKILEDENIKF